MLHDCARDVHILRLLQYLEHGWNVCFAACLVYTIYGVHTIKCAKLTGIIEDFESIQMTGLLL